MARQSHWKEVIEGEARKRLVGLAQLEMSQQQLMCLCSDCGKLMEYFLPLRPSEVTKFMIYVESQWREHRIKYCKPPIVKLPEPPKPTVTRHITFED